MKTMRNIMEGIVVFAYLCALIFLGIMGFHSMDAAALEVTKFNGYYVVTDKGWWEFIKVGVMFLGMCACAVIVQLWHSVVEYIDKKLV